VIQMVWYIATWDIKFEHPDEKHVNTDGECICGMFNTPEEAKEQLDKQVADPIFDEYRDQLKETKTGYEIIIPDVIKALFNVREFVV